MHNLLKYTAVALILGATAGAAEARVTVGFNLGDVAIGYSDGYYDHSHNWHGWRRHNDMLAWQRGHHTDYHNWLHDDRRHR